tara:strand:- start:30 stop:737 length:708 start_codon:yes stop_codon:yes gene_type:complete
MKKIILTAALLVFSSFSANALDRSSFAIFDLTAGLASNSSVFGASAKEENFSADTDNTLVETNTDEGVFTESFSSQFIELGIGRWISLGYEHTPDSISTPKNVANEGQTNEATVQVDFNDMNTTYLKLNIPGGGMYIKYGNVETDMDIKETVGAGVYKNTSISGTSLGAGYQKLFGESGFGFRVEGNYLEFDNVTVNDGDTTGTIANNGKNKITASNLEGLTGKVALTYTFGRNN